MAQSLSLQNVVARLVQHVRHDFYWQIMDEQHPFYGAYFNKDSGLEESGHGGTSRFVMSCGLILLVMEQHPHILPSDTPPQDELISRIMIALDYMHKAQRPSGLIDLRSTNYDSSPDTGFVVELLCALTSIAQGSKILAEPLGKIESFIRRAVSGMRIGGFHTPNHRWVIVSALSQARKLFDLDVDDVISSYIAEGFDADEEGAYIERSVGIYDSVSNRALMFFAENWDISADVESALDAVNRNLDFDLHLLHADGTAETGLSRRQDYGTRSVPISLITPLLQYNANRPEDRYIKAAQWLWEKTNHTGESNIHWHTYVLLKYGVPEESKAEIPSNFVRFYPKNQIWRIRKGEISTSVFGGATRLMTLTSGEIELSSIKISQTYFGVGHFIAETMTAQDNWVVLHSSGIQKPHKPGYELPLNRPVPPESWQDAFAERDVYPIPPATSELKVESVENGFDFQYRTLDGLDQVPVQIAFDFPAGGYWETDDTALQTQSEQVIFLKSGYGYLRYGDDVIRIGKGSDGHRYYSMRHAEPVPSDQVRILITFLTPVDHDFSIRLYKGFFRDAE